MVKISESYHVTRTGRCKKNPARYGGSEYLTISKMPHQDGDNPSKEKEYLCEGHVAKIEEWKTIARKNNFKGLRIFETNQPVRFEFV